jgi:hypothetical protein
VLNFLGVAEFTSDDDPGRAFERHPHGSELLAKVAERQRVLKDAWLTEVGHQRPGMAKGLPLAEAQARAAIVDTQIRTLHGRSVFPGPTSSWHGFVRFDFPAGERTASVIVPRAPLPGNPWAWKGEFLDAFPEVEIALLSNGFHVVYLSTPDMLGSPEAVRLWNLAYQDLTQRYKLAPKVALIALSRAGLYCYNWGASNPEKVACIYADAAVCDFKSWPGGRGKGKGSPRDWELVLRQYHFQSERQALEYRFNPIDNLAPLAAAKIPLLHVYGDADDVVPWEENTGVIAERYRKLGGSITLISKPGVGHHPHGLEDPTRIVEFIQTHARVTTSAK